MILKNRRSIRLKEYDYSEPGEYFVTICTEGRSHLFGYIDSDAMHENELGKVVRICWQEMPEHYPHVELDEFVVMPNHVHGIVLISGDDTVGAIHESPLPRNTADRRRMTLSKIVGRFKMNSAKRINQLRGSPGIRVWQRNYFEHIIRDDKSLDRIREYIASNPEQWHHDKENTQQEARDKFDEWLSTAGMQPITRR